jgi:TRAP-type transport system small permease protein
MSDGLGCLDRVLTRITRIMSAIAAMAVLCMMLLNVADICARYFLHLPIRGAHELVEFSMILAVFLGIPYVQHGKTNISVSLLTDRFPRKAKVITEGIMCILSLGIIGIMTWEAFGYFWRMWERGKETTVLALPVAPFQFIVAVGLFVLFIVIIAELLHSISDIFERKRV